MILEPARLALLAELTILLELPGCEPSVAAAACAGCDCESLRLSRRLKKEEAVLTRRIEPAKLDRLLAEPRWRLPVVK